MTPPASVNLCGGKRKRHLVACLAGILVAAGSHASAYELSVQPAVSTAGQNVDLSVNLIANETPVAALVFEVEYDTTRLQLDLQTNKSGPAPALGASYSADLFALGADEGRIGVSIYDHVAPVSNLPDGGVLVLRFHVKPEAEGYAAVRIVGSPAPDAADAAGSKVAEWNPPAGRTGIFIAASRADLSASPSHVEFGSVERGRTAERDLFLINSGNTPTTLQSIRVEPFDGPFQIARNLAGQTVAAHGVSAIPLRFLHEVSGTHSAKLVIEVAESRLEVVLTASIVDYGSFAHNSRFLIPAAARLYGAGGSTWLSSLSLVNPSMDTVSTLISVLPALGTRATTEVLLEPGESRHFGDVAAELFSQSELSAALIVDSSSPDLVLRSTTLNRDPDGGLLGQAVPAIPWRELFHSGQIAYLAGLEHTEMRQTKVALLNLSEIAVALRVTVLEGSSTVAERTYVLEPGEIVQNIDLFSALENTGDHLVVAVAALTSDAVFFTYASTIDRRTGGPVFQSPR